MEVHAHTHTARKKWTHYLWEFLMLFLAVFCGFLAENFREHKIEHLRAKEFAKSLVQDLQNDTSAINAQKKSAEIFIAITDSLLERSKKKLDGRNAAEFSFYTRFIYWTVPITWNRATFEQIKNSGSLRYFKNYQLLDKLMKYDAHVNAIEGEFSNHQTRGNMLLKLINEIIDPGYHHDLSKYRLLSLDTMSRNTREYYFSVKIEPLETKRDKIREMLNMIVVQQRNLRFNADTRLEPAKELKKEYHLK
jgi:hypothetical protein